MKPFKVLKNWTYRRGILEGSMIDGALVTDTRSPIVVLKDSGDTYILEYDNIVYLLDPPAKPGQFPIPSKETK